MKSVSSLPLTTPVLTISRCDRWQACQRLQALDILCDCRADGRLHVEIDRPIVLVQLRSVIQQLTASRSELIDWLEQCWRIPTMPDINP
ncbi:Asr1405/Asl0597 family protein [Pantanalinema rosaneae CENA516]|uniref:Asr1405/Asl0597 family protein n=1 Tax=Pantanalinema rosaneae TaxID=1620701 RepID=UPI003D6E1713